MTVEGLAATVFRLVLDGERAAPGADVFAWSEAARKVRRQVGRSWEADEPAALATALAELKERVRARLEATSLAERGGLARATFLLETLISLVESPERVYEAYPGVEADATELAVRFSLDRRAKARAEHHLALVHHGDLGWRSRAPHLLRAFFRRVLDGSDGGRAAALHRELLARAALYPDYFLWSALLRDDPAGTRDLFRANDEAAVAARLDELLANDRTFELALRDADRRHAGLARFVAGQYAGRALAVTRNLAGGAASWIDVLGDVGSPDLADGLALAATERLSLDTRLVDASFFEHVLPLTCAGGELRLMDEEAAAAYARRLGAPDVRHARVAVLEKAALEAAVEGLRRPVLYTVAGSYLDSIGLGGPELRARAIERRAKAGRAGATKLARAVLGALHEGDALALFARPGLPSYAGVSFVALEIDDRRRPRVRAICHVGSGPERRERWQTLA